MSETNKSRISFVYVETCVSYGLLGQIVIDSLLSTKSHNTLSATTLYKVTREAFSIFTLENNTSGPRQPKKRVPITSFTFIDSEEM